MKRRYRTGCMLCRESVGMESLGGHRTDAERRTVRIVAGVRVCARHWQLVRAILETVPAPITNSLSGARTP